MPSVCPQFSSCIQFIHSIGVCCEVYTTCLFVETCVQTSLACSANPQRVSLGCLSNSFSYLKTFLFLDVSGYIKKATAKKLSSKSNPYLDTIIQSEHGTQ